MEPAARGWLDDFNRYKSLILPRPADELREERLASLRLGDVIAGPLSWLLHDKWDVQLVVLASAEPVAMVREHDQHRSVEAAVALHRGRHLAHQAIDVSQLPAVAIVG